MPFYRCPNCGRTVEQPIGEYTCKVCGSRMMPVEATVLPISKRLTPDIREPTMSMWELGTKINSLVAEEEAAAVEYAILGDKAYELGLARTGYELSNISLDESKHRDILKELSESMKTEPRTYRK